MRTLSDHDLGVPDPALVACHITSRLHRLEEALGATRREVPLDASAARRLVGPEQGGRVLDDVVLHGADARKGQHIQAVFGTVERQGVLEELVHLVAGGVHQAEDAAAAPILIPLLHGQQLRQNLLAGQAVLGNRRVGKLVQHDRAHILIVRAHRRQPRSPEL
jgi:hypothetical protein